MLKCSRLDKRMILLRILFSSSLASLSFSRSAIFTRTIVTEYGAEDVSVHRNDDSAFYALHLCTKYKIEDCSSVKSMLKDGFDTTEYVYRIPFTNLHTYETRLFELPMYEHESVHGMVGRWCTRHGYDTVPECMDTWRPEQSDIPLLFVNAFVTTDNNQGDISGFHIMHYFARQFGMHTINRYSADDLITPCVITVGSLLNWLPGACPCTIIGTGLIQDPKVVFNQFPFGLDIRGVRGPLTAAIADVGGEAESISDPALLLPRVFPREDFEASTHGEPHNAGAADARHEIGFIIHTVDRESFFAAYPQYREHLIDNHQPMMTHFLARLFQYKRVLSSGLHGAVIAHAYGIPVAVFQVTDLIIGGDFKFVDYFQSVGHHSFTTRPRLEDIGNFSVAAIVEFVNNFWQPEASYVESLRQKQEILIRDYLLEVKTEYAYPDPISETVIAV